MKKLIVLSLVIGMIHTSCQKEFLEAKPDKSLLVPTTLPDMRLLLDNISVMNRAPAMQEIASDDLFTNATGYLALTIPEKNSYTWAEDIYQGASSGDWTAMYQEIFYSNLVLDGLNQLGNPKTMEAMEIQGAAYFYRGLALFYLTQLFTVPYQKSNASAELGIPIRLSANVNEKSSRGSLQQTYEQIISDLKRSEEFLPTTTSVKSRPNKVAVSALLARVYLSMGEFEYAENYANESLKSNGKLIDYNSLNPKSDVPFPTALPGGNDEVIFLASLLSYSFFNRSFVDPELYNLYATNDLRKEIFYLDRGTGGLLFKGSYSGAILPSSPFGGLTSDEMYLTRAECLARKGDTKAALDDLNRLLLNRYVTGTFVAIQASDANDALGKILIERRKELVRRGTRWTDLRRLNLDSKYAITLKRVIEGTTFTLAPNSNRYVFPIPENEIKASGIEQNLR